jgi:tellurite resistance protein TehA-like permease
VDTERPAKGWTIGRILGLIIGLLGMAGFGLCSLCGIVLGAGSPGDMAMVMAFVLPGLGLTFLFFLLARAMIRKVRGAPRE